MADAAQRLALLINAWLRRPRGGPHAARDLTLYSRSPATGRRRGLTPGARAQQVKPVLQPARLSCARRLLISVLCTASQGRLQAHNPKVAGSNPNPDLDRPLVPVPLKGFAVLTGKFPARTCREFKLTDSGHLPELDLGLSEAASERIPCIFPCCGENVVSANMPYAGGLSVRGRRGARP